VIYYILKTEVTLA